MAITCDRCDLDLTPEAERLGVKFVQYLHAHTHRAADARQILAATRTFLAPFRHALKHDEPIDGSDAVEALVAFYETVKSFLKEDA